LLVLILVLAMVTSAAAATIEIPLDTIVVAPEGSLTLLATVDTPAELVGATCISFAQAVNPGSVHPDNDLIVRTGDSEVVLEDVEGSTGKVTTAEGPVTLGPTITVTLRMGPDGIFSAGMTVEYDLDCQTPTTTTTTTTAPPQPAIEIVKVANSEFYSSDGVATFTIEVTNPGPVDLVDVVVTDQDALDIDPNSDCARVIGNLAVGESFSYECSVSGLDGISPFDNEACATGADENGTEVSDCDSAVEFPQVLATTVTTSTTVPESTTAPPTTQPPGSSTEETLPETGAESRDLAFGGVAAVFVGLALLLATGRLARPRRDS
jgi:uncharacterized repeat protein (TIGR01451 family)